MLSFKPSSSYLAAWEGQTGRNESMGSMGVKSDGLCRRESAVSRDWRGWRVFGKWTNQSYITRIVDNRRALKGMYAAFSSAPCSFVHNSMNYETDGFVESFH